MVGNGFWYDWGFDCCSGRECCIQDLKWLSGSDLCHTIVTSMEDGTGKEKKENDKEPFSGRKDLPESQW